MARPRLRAAAELTVPARRPDFSLEAALHAQGCSLVAGLDEVGRGPLAGPVVAAAVVLPREPDPELARMVRDSKQMRDAERRQAYRLVLEKAVAVGIGSASPREIDDAGIVGATRRAMRRALDDLPAEPDFLLLDAFPLPGTPIPQKAIVKGDALCLSIAAASVVAKVVRDSLMVEAHRAYPRYGFDRHKGYATRRHLESLERWGPCPLHRFSFAPVRRWRGLL